MDIVAIYLLANGAIGAALGALRGRALAGFFFGALLSFIGWLLIYFGPDYNANPPGQRRPKPRGNWR